VSVATGPRVRLLLGVLVLACGCVDVEVARFAHLRAASAPHQPASLPASAAVGRSCVTVVGIVPVTGLPNLGAALAAAAGNGTLRDVVVRYELRYVPLLGGRGCYVVEGRGE
jgi:hypothetical protein